MPRIAWQKHEGNSTTAVIVAMLHQDSNIMLCMKFCADASHSICLVPGLSCQASPVYITPLFPIDIVGAVKVSYHLLDCVPQ